MARAGADDVTAVGPAGLVLPAVEEFARQVEEHCLLHWEKTKSEVFTWDGELPPGTPAGLVWFPNPLAAGSGLGERRGQNALFFL